MIVPKTFRKEVQMNFSLYVYRCNLTTSLIIKIKYISKNYDM